MPSPLMDRISSQQGRRVAKYRGEVWKMCAGSSTYEVSDKGRVRRADTKKVKRLTTNNAGYVATSVEIGGKRITKLVHLLVMLTFVGPRPEGHEIDHQDTNRHNNALDNLEYVTRAENRRRKKGRKPIKLTDAQVREIRRLKASGLNRRQIVYRMKLPEMTVRDVIWGYSYAAVA